MAGGIIMVRSDTNVTPAGRRGLSARLQQRETEWEVKRDVPIVAGAIAVSAALVLCAALAVWPFAGTQWLWVLGITLILLLHASVGSLAAGVYIELKHPQRTRLHGGDHVVLYVVLGVVAIADGLLSWWLFGRTNSWLRWGHLVLIALGLGIGGFTSWKFVWPRRGQQPASEHHSVTFERWHLFDVVSALLGFAAGVVLAFGTVLLSAAYRNAELPNVAPDSVPVVSGIAGSYLALGDSYSAGEGLRPFDQPSILSHCNRSVHAAYPELLRFSQGHVIMRFVACSGAIISNLLHPRGGSRPLPAQLDGRVHQDVGLVTLTIGGNNALFAKIVNACFTEADCLSSTFPPVGARGVERNVAPGPLAKSWAPATTLAVGHEYTVLFKSLRTQFPNARIVVIGYPYLFPDSRAGLRPDDCTSILRRFSRAERMGIRSMQDQFNNLIYEEAVAAHIEFVSPVAIWRGHEPCGDRSQYTNSIKPFLSYSHPVDGGTFHPNAAGQQTLAALVGCYLNAYPTPPDPFEPGKPQALNIPSTELVGPSQLGLVSPPGFQSSLPGCP
jgi:GDSL-like Lipase/Acylhydrolase family